MTTWNPAEYQQHSSQQQRWARDILVRLTLRGDERILDLGCGDGKITAELARSVPRGHLTGIDASPEMIAHAQRTFPSAAHPNLSFLHADARRLPFASQFDWVVSFATLHWIHDHAPVLAGIRRGLRPDGRVFLQFGGRGNAAEIIAVAARVTQRAAWFAYFEGFQIPWAFYSPEEYRPWLVAAGLTPVRVELIDKDMTHANHEDLAGWLRTTWMPYLQRVPELCRMAFVEAILDEYLAARPADADGTVHLKMVRLEVEARV